jgi:hypothetical protein
MPAWRAAGICVGLGQYEVEIEHLFLARGGHHVAAGLLQQRQEQVFDLDFVLAEPDADAGRAGGGDATGVVQLANQGLQVDVHRRVLWFSEME